MEDKTNQAIMLRTLSAVLLVLALGMTAARVFSGLDISGVLIVSLLTIAISNATVAHSISKKENEAD